MRDPHVIVVGAVDRFLWGDPQVHADHGPWQRG